MDYKIVMPVLSDTMEKGKLIKWHVQEGDVVHAGDVVAEVESDKAIMEVQTFKEGVVKKLLAKEGDEVPVKAPIAIIEVDEAKSANKPQPTPPTSAPAPQPSKEKPQEPPLPPELLFAPKIEGEASPAAKKRAAELGVDIESMQEKGELPKPAHLKDIEKEALKRYFTPKALELLQDFNIDPSVFRLDHKYSAEEILAYIQEHNIPKTVHLSPNRLAVAKMVQKSAMKPTFFIFENVMLNFTPRFKLTAYLIKALALAMERHELTRAKLQEDRLLIYPNANISVAVAKEKELYMVVCKEAQRKSLEKIEAWLHEVKAKESFSAQELQGSTFGLSNLGMFGIKRFSAMIYDEDVGIGAFGALEESNIAVTFTFDHRIINGVDAAQFVKEFKMIFENFKEA